MSRFSSSFFYDESYHKEFITSECGFTASATVFED